MWKNSEVAHIGTARTIVHNPKNDKKYSVQFVVVHENLVPIIGTRAAQRMNIITVHDNSFVPSTPKPVEILPLPANVYSMSTTKHVISQYPDVFDRPVILDEILPELPKAKVFSTVDLRSGYWHCPLDTKSSMVTTFSTANGCYRWL